MWPGLGLAGALAFLIVVIVIAIVHRRRELRMLAAPVQGERDLAVLPVRLVQMVQHHANTTTPIISGVTDVRVTNRRLVLEGGGTPLVMINLEPAPAGAGHGALPAVDHDATVLAASRDAVASEHDRVDIGVRGDDGEYTITRVLIQLDEARQLAELIATGASLDR